MDSSKKIKLTPMSKIRSSIDNLLTENREQKLKAKLGKKIQDSIFTEEILKKVNECDFTGSTNNEDRIIKLFGSMFPVCIKDNGAEFRVYKHKIEMELSDEVKDRYIYIFSDGRLTSKLFKCFSLVDDEYLYAIERIIDVIPKIKDEIFFRVSHFKDSMGKSNEDNKNIEDREKIARENYNKLEVYFAEKMTDKIE